MSLTTSTLPATPTIRRTTIAIVGALLAAAIALTIFMATTGSTNAPTVSRSRTATVDHVGTADAAERRANLADVYRGDSQRVGSADAGESWSSR